MSLTTTLNGNFGCGVLVPEFGILLNNEMDDFATAPGKPNLYGLVQGEANAVGPGKRMLSSMAPTVAWRGSQVLVLGSPGGSRIPTATAQVFLNVVVDGDAAAGRGRQPSRPPPVAPRRTAVRGGCARTPDAFRAGATGAHLALGREGG